MAEAMRLVDPGSPDKSRFIQVPTLIVPVVESITVSRAAFLDELHSDAPIKVNPNSPSNNPVAVPYDIDDLELTDDFVRTATVDAMQEQAARVNPLNWQHASTDQYRQDLRAYSQELKARYVKHITEATTGVGDVRSQDIKTFTTVRSITRKMGMPNVATLDVSLLRMRELGADLSIIPRENDVVEIKTILSENNVPVRTFIGLITAITYEEKYGTVTTMTLECHGIMKQLMISRMVTDRAVIGQFESGELLSPSLSVWSSNAFAGNSIDQIFTSIMTAQMGMKVTTKGDNTQNAGLTLLGVELASIGTKLSQLDASKLSLSKEMQPGNTEISDAGIKQTTLIATAAETFVETVRKTYIEVAESEVHRDATIGLSEIDALIIESKVFINDHHPSKLFNFDSTITPAEEQDRIRRFAALLLTEAKLRRRRAIITEQMQKARQDEIDRLKSGNTTNTPLSVVRYSMDASAFTSPDAFQLAYVPMINFAIRQINEGNDANTDIVTARFSGRQLLAFDQLIRKSFELFFSQLKSPQEVLKSIEQTAKFVVYEDNVGRIVCEIPRYNEFVADPGENIEDFIILNPLSTTFMRQDASMIARQDVKKYIPYVGPLENVPSFIARHYTDHTVLTRYGMRATAPTYNPNAQEPISQASFAAIEVAVKNAETRSIKVSADLTKDYKIGRMYFIARQFERLAGTQAGAITDVHSRAIPGKPTPPPSSKLIPARLTTVNGYVGYLDEVSSGIPYGQVSTQQLTFRYVRKARLLISDDEKVKFKANFRLLPDVGTMINLIEDGIAKGNFDPGPDNTTSTASLQPGDAESTNTADSATVYLSDVAATTVRPPKFKPTSVFLPSNPPQVSRQRSTGKIVNNITFSKELRLLGTHHSTATTKTAGGVIIGGSKTDGLPPSTSGVTTDSVQFNVGDKIAVIRLSEAGGGLSQGLIDELSLADLRLRMFSTILTSTQPWDKDDIDVEVVATDTTSKFRNKLIRKQRLVMKDKLFRLIYIPDINTNPFARLDTLDGMNITFIDPKHPTTSIRGDISTQLPLGLPDNKNAETLNITPFSAVHFALHNPSLVIVSFFGSSIPGIFISGTPIKVANNVKDHFVILLSNPPELLAGKPSSGRLSAANPPAEFRTLSMTGGPTVTLRGYPIDLISANKTIITDYVSSNSSVGTVDEVGAAFDKAIATFTSPDGQPLLTNPMFVPVIIHSNSSSVSMLRNYNPGIPLTILDAAHNGGRVRGLTTVNDQSSKKTNLHAKGMALDIAMAPLYAKMGVVPKVKLLIPSPSDIMDKALINFGKPVRDSLGSGTIDSLNLILQDPAIIIPEATVSISASGSNPAEKTTVGTKAIKSIPDTSDATKAVIGGDITGASKGSMTINDIFVEEDKGIYHIEAPQQASKSAETI